MTEEEKGGARKMLTTLVTLDQLLWKKEERGTDKRLILPDIGW